MDERKTRFSAPGCYETVLTMAHVGQTYKLENEGHNEWSRTSWTVVPDGISYYHYWKDDTVGFRMSGSFTYLLPRSEWKDDEYILLETIYKNPNNKPQAILTTERGTQIVDT